jgi:hypothetical protein
LHHVVGFGGDCFINFHVFNSPAPAPRTFRSDARD